MDLGSITQARRESVVSLTLRCAADLLKNSDPVPDPPSKFENGDDHEFNGPHGQTDDFGHDG
jgi:hypothetical protein